MQFGLRSLLVFVTLCCVLLALGSVVGEIWALAVAWLIVLIAVHVSANAWGTRLRGPGGLADAVAADPPVEPRPVVFAPTSRLRQRCALSWLRFAVSGVLACIGCGLALYLMALLGWAEIGYGSVAIAGVSASVIGGILGFLASSFLEEALRSWSEAIRFHRK